MVDLFLYPFLYDANSYIVDLIELWDADAWIELKQVVVGETKAPTPAPTIPTAAPGVVSNLSSEAIWAISASIVLAAILLVGYLFYDRNKKEKLLLQGQGSQDYDAMQFSREANRDASDNNWPRNFSTASDSRSQPPPTPDRQRLRRLNTSESARTAPSLPSTSLTLTNSSRHNRTESSVSNTNISLPSRMGLLGNSLTLSPPLPPAASHARHTSIAASEITDITYSDGQGGGRSDTASDGSGNNNNNNSGSHHLNLTNQSNSNNSNTHNANNGSNHNGLPILPTINDEYYERDTPWAPVQIAENDSQSLGEDDYSDAIDSPIDTGLLGLSPSMDPARPSMSGFQMQVEELE